ncbi:MAG: hypothetical protein AB1757_01265 [Acidobacteriota bacterium]
MNHQFIRRAIHLSIAFLLIIFFTANLRAQNCKKLTPAGDGLDDAAIINNCLQTRGFARLKGGNFLLYSPIVFPRSTPEKQVSGMALTGKGKDLTKLIVQSECSRPFATTQDGATTTYQAVIQTVKSREAWLSGFEVDVSNLRQDCNINGNFIILINKSPASRVTEVRIKGSPYDAGSLLYTTGGANSGGILVVNSETTEVAGNEIKDVGFTFETGGTSAANGGIEIANSANSIVNNNRLEHVAFGITVLNGSPAHGYTGDSSGTVVSNNAIVGAANLNCANCSQGRAVKLQACGDGSELPLKNLQVTNNDATEFGGHLSIIGGSGLDLVCGVQNSLFENNRFVGGSTAEFSLQIRSSYFELPQNPTYHNRFQFNTFISGRGSVYCRDNCVDVNFTHDGPDQIGIRRNGENFKGSNSATSFRAETDRGCDDYSRPFFLYLDGREFVRHGERILLTALGVRPGSQVTFKIHRAEDNREVLTYTGAATNRYCIMNQEYLVIDENKFPAGEYKIFADYKDGNSNATISGDMIGTIKVKPEKNQ